MILSALIYVCLRGLVLYSAFDETVLSVYELHPMGTIAKLIVERVSPPLQLYYDNAGGQIFTGLAAVPFFAVLGDSYLSLKLVPATLGLLTLVGIYCFLRANFGRLAADIGALLFALGPVPTLTKYSVIASGNHFENLLFVVIAALVFHRLWASDDRLWLFLAGWCAGFAIFVFLGALIPVGLLMLTHVGVRGWRRTIRDCPLYGSGFILGLLPLLLLNAGSDWRGGSFVGAKFRDAGGWWDVASRIWDYLFVELPRAGCFEPFLGLPASVASTLFTGCFLLAWMAAFPRAARGLVSWMQGVTRKETGDAARVVSIDGVKWILPVLYLPLSALAFGLSDLRIGGYAPPLQAGGYRYFNPHFLFATFLIAAIAGEWCASGRPLRGRAIAGVAIFASLWNFSLVDLRFTDAGLGSYYAGHSFAQAARALANPRAHLLPRELIAFGERLEPPYRYELYRGIGSFRAILQQAGDRRSGVAHAWSPEALVADFPIEAHAYLARGMGTRVRGMVLRAGPGEGGVVLHALQSADSFLGGEVIVGMAEDTLILPLHQRVSGVLAENLHLLEVLDSAARPHLARGMGLLCGKLVRRAIPQEVEGLRRHVDAIPAPWRKDFARGFGWGLVEATKERDLPPLALTMIPPENQEELREGYQAALRHIWGEAPSASSTHFPIEG